MRTAAGDRRVRALRLRAPDTISLQRGVALLEDALRTASLPRAGSGRVLVVRSLALGRIGTSRSAPSIALVIEERLRALESAAVWALSAGASAAEAVFFRDEAEPIVGLARRVARGEPAHDWFWQRLVPASRLRTSRSAALRLLMLDAGALQAPVPALCAVVSDAVAAGATSDLCAELGRDDAVRLANACGWRWIEREPTPAEDEEGDDRSAALDELSTAAAARWDRGDPRTRLLCALALVQARPSLAGSLLVAARATRLAHDVGSSARGVAHTRRAGTFVGEAPGDANRTLAETHHGESRTDAITDLATSAHRELHDHPTAFGGYYFLVQLLERLGLSASLVARPELTDADLQRRLMARAARSLGVPPNDPVLAAIPEQMRTAEPDDPVLRLELDRWWRDMRRWAATNPRRRLRDVVRRPARVAISRTHVDVTLAHATVDIAIRRVGLDVDPGWVPWLGRVVRFHYVDTQDVRPARSLSAGRAPPTLGGIPS